MRKITGIIYCVLCNTVSIGERWYRFRKPESSDPDKMITLCKMKIIRKGKLMSSYNKCAYLWALKILLNKASPILFFITDLSPTRVMKNWFWNQSELYVKQNRLRYMKVKKVRFVK